MLYAFKNASVGLDTNIDPKKLSLVFQEVHMTYIQLPIYKATINGSCFYRAKR